MKILYAIQGTGNGHLSRAKDIIPALETKGEVDILVSGTQGDIALNWPIKYLFHGLSFVFGTKGGVDIHKTLGQAKPRLFLKELLNLPVQKYDLVVNDFEPISAWACKLKNVPCISLSHQSALLSRKVPQPETKNWFGKMVLKYYAPSAHHIAFHFKKYDKNIFHPVIRNEIRNQTAKVGKHYTVYLPAYSDKRIIDVLSQISGARWEVFSKHAKKITTGENFIVQPINSDKFIASMVSSNGVLCGSGFETPAEALYLKKKLLVIPMKGQYEQHCNAASLEEMGVAVVPELSGIQMSAIENWVSMGKSIPVTYSDELSAIADRVMTLYAQIKNEETKLLEEYFEAQPI